MTETYAEVEMSEDASRKGAEMLMLLISDAPFSQVIKAIEEFNEAAKGEVIECDID